MIKIRQGGTGDAAVFARIGTETFTDTFGRLYGRADLEEFLAKNHSVGAYAALLGDKEHALWLAETESGEIAGYCVAGPNSLPAPNPPDRAGELARLYISNRHQGERLGERMILTALEWLDARYERSYLSVWYENDRAQALYKKHGFLKVHDYYYMVGDHADPEWIMERRRG